MVLVLPNRERAEEVWDGQGVYRAGDLIRESDGSNCDGHRVEQVKRRVYLNA